MSVAFREPAAADTAAIRAIARDAFVDTFAGHFPPEPFARYLDDAYGPAGTMIHDLANPAIRWRIAEAGGEIVGYVKLTALHAPAPDPRPGAIELRQLYVARAWHGRGVAGPLIEWAIDTARRRGAPELYLAVFDWNRRATAFYARYGFAQVGTFDFDLGGMAARDTIMRLVL